MADKRMAAPCAVNDGEMIELTRDFSASPLYNEDLAPTRIADRTWSVYSFISLWIGMSCCIPTYMMAAGFIKAGMDWKQALFTIFLGNVIVLIPMILNGRIGVRYGVSFPVFCRAPFGTKGANVPALMRALVACGWFGIQTWLGGAAMNAMLAKSVGFDNVAVSFMIFWFINILIVWKGMETVKRFEHWTAPLLIVFSIVMLWWALDRAGGWGPIAAQPSAFKTGGEFFKVFIPSLTGVIGFWATLSLNILDFTRFARSQRDQIVGQTIGLPLSMAAFSLVGLLTASATLVIFGTAIWDPTELIQKFDDPLVLLTGVICISIATLTTNIAANIVSPAYDFSNMFPKTVNFKRGALITGIIGILMMPWKLLSDFSAYIFGWLVGYSAFLGPICGIMLTDYFLLRGRNIDLDELFNERGIYSYGNGYNPASMIALAVGIGLGLIGLVVPALAILYDYAWFVGFFGASVVYYLLMQGKVAAPAAAGAK